jgi:hypothetical protein
MLTVCDHVRSHVESYPIFPFFPGAGSWDHEFSL